MPRVLATLLLLTACQKAPERDPPHPQPAPTPPPVTQASVAPVAPAPAPAPPPAPPAAPPKATLDVELTAVTLADDCGGSAPATRPVTRAKGMRAEPGLRSDAAGARLRKRCEQTSMQLAITAPDATVVAVKSVELFDETGRLLGKLTASKPTRWSVAKGAYEPWDQAIAASATENVSYVLSQPPWDRIGDRWNKTFTLKTVITVGGVDAPVKKDVTLRAPTALPPNVRT